MSDQELRDLQNPETWDFEGAEKRSPVKEGRTVVSVAFPRRDFARVSEAAERAEQRVSEFIREAALEKASSQASRAGLTSYSASYGSAIFTRKPNPTRVVGVVVRRHEEAITA